VTATRVGLGAATHAAQLAGRDPSSPAVVGEAEAWTTAELFARAAAAASWLDEAGVRPGGLVPAVVDTSPAAVALWVGAVGSGRCLAPLGTRLTERELVGCVARLQAPVLVAAPEAADLAAAVSRDLGRRLVEMPAFAPTARRLEFFAEAHSPALVLHTSGTGGLPKPVLVRHDRLAHRVRANAALLGLGPGAVYASASGFHHIAGLGMLLVALGAGAAVAPYGRFSADAWRELERRRVTHAFLVPTLIDTLLAEGALASRHLRVLQYGSSPIHPDTLRGTIEALPGVRLVQMFGQTEGSPVTVLTPQDHQEALAGRPELLRSVGRAAPGVELRIECPDAHGVGEVVARAQHLFSVDAEGWLHSGDLGRLGPNGYLYLAGRRGDKIIRGGENIYPIEVEEVLLRHPAVAEAAVVGVPDRHWGEVAKAVLVLADGGPAPPEEELRAFCRRELAGFKVPALWEYRERLPRSTAGKVLRRLLA
jgi:acyl-CoA synthetase (AMP-forming)/AMP-acid ligase II